jgi:hypothetical protein
MLELTMRAKLWLYPGVGGWHFITLPKKHAAAIKRLSGPRRHGWGAVRVIATIGWSTWKTSIFPEQKSSSYVLPVKVKVRKAEHIGDGDLVTLRIRPDL